MQKLPKSWRHWCKQNKLEPMGYARGLGRQDFEWFYLKGHGRMWRLNCHAVFECGDTYAEFDRWALCDITSAPRPNTLQEFSLTVKLLLALKEAGDINDPI